MAHPVNSFDYLVNQWQFLKNQYSYYAFFLFTEDNTDFAKLFQEMFFRWDDISGEGTMFFAIAPPPEGWEEIARDRGYWQHFKANSHEEIDFDHDAVKQVGRYFNVPDSTFPNVVVFSDLKRTQTLTIQLGGLSTEENRNYIENIFRLLNNPVIRRYRELWRIHPLIDLLPTDKSVTDQWIGNMVQRLWGRGRRVSLRDVRRGVNVQGERLEMNGRVTEHDNLIPVEQTILSLTEEMRRLSDQVNRLGQEQREQFERVHVSLERIENVLNETADRIDERRASFVERWMEVEYVASSSEEVAKKRAELIASFDDFILTQSDYLVRRIRSTLHIPSELVIHDDILEPNSRAALETSEALWSYLSRNPDHASTDFSMCGIGLWKALEIELNRTFVDALRVHHGMTTRGTQSVQQLVARTSRVAETGFFGGQGDKPVRLNSYTDSDPTINPTQLKGLSLGAIAGLLQATPRNSLDSVTQPIALPLAPTDQSRHDFFKNLGLQVQAITNRYRNTHAHMRRMSKPVYEAFRQLLLDRTAPHSPLFRTLDCKKEMDNGNII